MKTRDVIDTLDAVCAHFRGIRPLGSGVKALELMRERLEKDGIEDFQGSLEEAAGRAAQAELELISSQMQARNQRIYELKAERDALKGELVAVRLELMASRDRVKELKTHRVATIDHVPFVLCPACEAHAYRIDHDLCPACGTANPHPRTG